MSFTVRDFFNHINTDTPSITIYDANYNILYHKDADKLLCRIDSAIWDSEIAWIDKADNTAIILRIYDDDEEE